MMRESFYRATSEWAGPVGRYSTYSPPFPQCPRFHGGFTLQRFSTITHPHFATIREILATRLLASRFSRPGATPQVFAVTGQSSTRIDKRCVRQSNEVDSPSKPVARRRPASCELITSANLRVGMPQWAVTLVSTAGSFFDGIVTRTRHPFTRLEYSIPRGRATTYDFPCCQHLWLDTG